MCDLLDTDDSSVETCDRCQNTDHTRVMLRIGDRYYCALLDTGAEISLIKKSVVEECRGELQLQVHFDQQIEIEGYTGKNSSMDGVVDLQVILPSGMKTYSHSFAIVKDNLIPHCLLLGVDFIVAHNLSLDVSTELLKQHLGETITAKLVATVEMEPALMDIFAEASADEDVLNQLELPFMASMNPEYIKSVQSDAALSALRENVGKAVPVEKWPDSVEDFKRYSSTLVVREDILMCKSDNYLTCVIPFQALIDLALSTHCSMAHIGREKLLTLLRKNVWHPKLCKIVDDVCTTCSKCQLNKVSSQRVGPPTLKIVSNYPFDLMAVDLVQFPRTSQGNIGCLVAVDHFSKWISVVPIRDKTPSTV